MSVLAAAKVAATVNTIVRENGGWGRVAKYAGIALLSAAACFSVVAFMVMQLFLGALGGAQSEVDRALPPQPPYSSASVEAWTPEDLAAVRAAGMSEMVPWPVLVAWQEQGVSLRPDNPYAWSATSPEDMPDTSARSKAVAAALHAAQYGSDPIAALSTVINAPTSQLPAISAAIQKRAEEITVAAKADKSAVSAPDYTDEQYENADPNATPVVVPLPATGGTGGLTTGAGAWGGYSNGNIPASALTSIGFSPNNILRTDAARQLESMNVAYHAAFGANICITDSYRDYPSQVRVKAQKGNLAATPGTSNHGWGLALDLCGGINNFGTPTRNWFVQNAPSYGWVSPGWAQPGSSKPEAWHWEFIG